MQRMRMQTEGWSKVETGVYRHESGVEVRYADGRRWRTRNGQCGWMVVGGRNDGAWASTATEAQFYAVDERAGQAAFCV